MINTKTVFVLGAGASVPYGYPTGAALRQKIIINFGDIMDRTRQQGGEASIYLPGSDKVKRFTAKFDKASTNAIDIFLKRHLDDDPEVVRIGKIAITAIMLECENQNLFNSAIFESDVGDWYSYILEELMSEMDTSKNLLFSDNKVSFITFNYDRSLEHFLHQGLISNFPDKHSDTLSSELRKIEFVHLHGQLAHLPWQDGSNVPYLHYAKGNIGVNTLLQIAEQIRVIGEEQDDKVVVRARQLLRGAERIFFLGFGFAPENLATLGVPETLSTGVKIFGTVLGMEKREIGRAKNIFGGLSQKVNYFFLEDVDSIDLLKMYLVR